MFVVPFVAAASTSSTSASNSFEIQQQIEIKYTTSFWTIFDSATLIVKNSNVKIIYSETF